MTEAEKKETLARIEAAEKELAELKAMVQSDDEVPDELDNIDKPLKIENGEKVYYVTTYGEILNTCIIDAALYGIANNHHRLFISEKYAQMYAEKTQLIADLLHFKWLYDRDFEPDWDNVNEAKYTVWYDHEGNIYRVDSTRTWENMSAVNFSTLELAQKCADWLNKKAGII